jgi:glutamyl-tRNA synthetase
MAIIEAMGWPVPTYAHIPLIHGPDGKKLSKRHGALGVEEYRDMGYIAAGMRNYLTRLGWSHGDDEFFTDAQAKEWFDLKGIGKSPARLDFKKLENICGQHMAAAEDAALLNELKDFMAATGQTPLLHTTEYKISQALPFLKTSAKTLPQLLEKAHFCLVERPIEVEEKAAKNLGEDARAMLSDLTPHLQNATWTRQDLEALLNSFAEDRGVKFGQLAGPLRAALAGRAATPSVFDMMTVLGQEESCARIGDAAG